MGRVHAFPKGLSRVEQWVLRHRVVQEYWDTRESARLVLLKGALAAGG